MNKQNIFVIVVVAVIMFGTGFLLSKNSIRDIQDVPPPETTVINTTTPVTIPEITAETTQISSDGDSTTSTANTKKGKTFVSKEYGFEFQYPENWVVSEKLTGNQIDMTGGEYAIFATITNPNRPGKEGTDIPMERIILSNGTTGCEGMSFGRTGMRAVTGAWEQGFGNIYYRQLCFVTDGNISKYWTLNISMSAFDKESQAILDKSMSTLKFYKHSFVYN